MKLKLIYLSLALLIGLTGCKDKPGTVADTPAAEVTATTGTTTATTGTTGTTTGTTAATGTTTGTTTTLSSTKAITSYSFTAANNTGLASDVTASISGTAITATLPSGRVTTGLVATYTTSGSLVKANTIAQTSGSSANDFSSTVSYTVIAADASETIYTVTVSVTAPLSTAKTATAFSFKAADNTGLPSDISATIAGASITAIVPYTYRGTTLVPSFTLPAGAAAKVAGIAQTSGTSGHDFGPDVTYQITAEDGSTQNYTVQVINTPLPDTGQTTSYTTTFGEDHDYNSVNQQSYTDNGDGTVTDNITKQVWQQATAAGTYNQANASLYCTNNTAALPGTGWRLPTAEEIARIGVNEGVGPLFNAVFTGSVSDYYWASGAYSGGPGYAYTFSAADARSLHLAPTTLYSVRCVRGTSPGGSIFKDNGDGTVSDQTTGLMWQQCIPGLSGTGCTTGVSIPQKWLDAVIYCEGLTLAGNSDWKLPDHNELQTLIDQTNGVAPYIDATYFPGSVNETFFSSTTYLLNTSFAMGIRTGDVHLENKGVALRARCVR